MNTPSDAFVVGLAISEFAEITPVAIPTGVGDGSSSLGLQDLIGGPFEVHPGDINLLTGPTSKFDVDESGLVAVMVCDDQLDTAPIRNDVVSRITQRDVYGMAVVLSPTHGTLAKSVLEWLCARHDPSISSIDTVIARRQALSEMWLAETVG